MLQSIWRKLAYWRKSAKNRHEVHGSRGGGLSCEVLEDRCLLSSSFVEYAIPTPQSVPFGITQGPDGNMWFTEMAGNKIGQLNVKTHAVTEYNVPTLLS